MTNEGNAMWNQGFMDGYNGVQHVPGKGQDYDDGYARGYATTQVEDDISLHEPQLTRR